MSPDRHPFRRLRNLVVDGLYFASDVARLVLGIFYYGSLGLLVISAVWRQALAPIKHSIQLVIGTGVLWLVLPRRRIAGSDPFASLSDARVIHSLSLEAHPADDAPAHPRRVMGRKG